MIQAEIGMRGLMTWIKWASGFSGFLLSEKWD